MGAEKWGRVLWGVCISLPIRGRSGSRTGSRTGMLVFSLMHTCVFVCSVVPVAALERHRQGKMPNKECEAKWGQQGNRLGGLMGIALYTLNTGLETRVGVADPANGVRLTECQSNCKSDDDCAAGLKCMVRISPSDTVPGCKLPAKFDTTTG